MSSFCRIFPASDFLSATLYYAVLEGVGFAIRANLDAIDPGGDGRLRFVGGGTKSAVWAQMLADILGRPIAIPQSASFATCQGAFLVAAEAFGMPRPQARLSRTIIPRPERQTRAKRLATSFNEATAFARGMRLRD
jgi:xylulokinase